MIVNRRYFYFYCTKFIFFIFVLLILKDVFILGDVDRYIQARPNFSIMVLLNSTFLLDFIAGNITYLTHEIFTHLVFFHLTFFSQIYLLHTARFTKGKELVLMCLFCLPSITIWSSIAGKEAVVVSITCIITAQILILHRHLYIKNKFLLLTCLYLLSVMKLQYLPAYLSILFVLYCRSKVKPIAIINLTSTFFLVICLSSLVVYFSTTIDKLSLLIPLHFDAGGSTSRINIYFNEHGDIFKLRPDWWLKGFWGITISEAKSSLTNIFSFLESVLLFTGILYLLSSKFISMVKFGKLNTVYLSILLFAAFYMIIVHYPMGILNAGSSLRYRSGFIISFIVLLAYQYINDGKINETRRYY